jgi:hypothetical protein
VVAGLRAGEPDRGGGADAAAGSGNDRDWLHIPAFYPQIRASAGHRYPASAMDC